MKRIGTVLLLVLVPFALIAEDVDSVASDVTLGLHAGWDALLKSHVSEGLVDYDAIRKAPADLDSYLATLAATDPATLSPDHQLAFWINAYNAFTVKLIVDNMPLKSIRDISSPWKQKRWRVGTVLYSLDTIEHQILRKVFHEPRIHFAIVCASTGCPDLQPWAYRGSAIKGQLDRVTRLFMASPKHIQTEVSKGLLGRKTRTLRMSKIFKWFGDDFTDGGKRSVVDFIRLYASDDTVSFLSEAKTAPAIKTLGYVWLLNALN
jgi:hypothetical protein